MTDGETGPSLSANCPSDIPPRLPYPWSRRPWSERYAHFDRKAVSLRRWCRVRLHLPVFCTAADSVRRIRPSATVPICIDVGTDNKQFLEDPLYLGLRQPRVPQAEMDELMEEFMHEMATVFPNLIIQFEDFSTDKVRHVFLYLVLDCSSTIS